MPRYRYKKIAVASPRLGTRVVEMKRVADAIAVLDAIGEGDVTITAATERYWSEAFDPKSRIAIDHLRGKNEQAVWDLFDLHIDVAIAKKYPFVGRLADPAANGRWPGCPPDILNFLDDLKPDSIYRLRHFAAIMIADIRIGDHLFVLSKRDRAAIDARLTDTEKAIAFRADLNSAVRDLLYLQ